MPKKVWLKHPDAGGVKIPDEVKTRTIVRLERHAQKHFSGRYTRLGIRFRYVNAFTEPDPNPFLLPGESKQDKLERMRNTPTHLCRLRYFGNEDRWSMGFFKYSDEKYELCLFESGDFYGTPEEAFELAARVYLEQ